MFPWDKYTVFLRHMYFIWIGNTETLWGSESEPNIHREHWDARNISTAYFFILHAWESQVVAHLCGSLFNLQLLAFGNEILFWKIFCFSFLVNLYHNIRPGTNSWHDFRCSMTCHDTLSLVPVSFWLVVRNYWLGSSQWEGPSEWTVSNNDW